MDEKITASESPWRYEAPKNKWAKVQLLTRTKIAIYGVWGSGLGIVAWCPIPKRDKQYEEANNL